MNILIVDDSPTNLKLLRLLLEAGGLSVREAANGIEALAVLKTGPVDAIISDILMPGMDGYRLCMAVRASPQSCDLPFIAYSATYTSVSDEKLMIDVGADRFLGKPATAAMLADTLQELVRSKRHRPPAPVRIRQETELLMEHNERLVTKLGQKDSELAEKDALLARAEDDLGTTQARLRRVLDHNPALICSLKWEDGKIAPHVASETVSRLLGLGVTETLSHEWWLAQLHPDDRALAIASISETVTHGASHTEYRLRHKDGSVRWVEDRRRVIRDVAGKPMEFTGVLTDITERKCAELAIREQRLQWQTVMAMATDALLVIQGDKLVLANPAAVRLLAARNEDELLGRRASDFMHEDDFAALKARSRLAVLDESRLPLLERKLRRVDRSVVDTEVGVARFQFRGRTALLVEVRDITERKRAESRLVLQHAVTAVLAEATSLSEINQRVLSTLGCGLKCELAELWTTDRNAHVLRCTDIWHPASAEFREFAAASRDRVFTSGQGLPGRVWASGKTEWCADISQDAACSRRDQASRIGLCGWIGFPIKLRQEVAGVVGFFGRKVAPPTAELLAFFDTVGLQLGQFIERQQVADQFRQAQKMEAIGMLAGGIAHDFNNILGAITGYSELAQMEAKGHAKVTEYIDGVLISARRATELVRQILVFSRRQEPERRPIQLRHIVTEATRLLRATVPVSIEFRTSLDKDTPVVLADATQVHQILMNLGTNAAHAMRERGGLLEVKLESCLVTADLVASCPELRVGRFARLTVRDNGHGMDKKTLDRLFEPFFTTKLPGEGTGLGLAVVHGIVKSHESIITVSSQPAEGTTFQVYFPAHLVDSEVEVKPSSEMPRGKGERILFVDDEVPIVEVGMLVLNSIGYVTDTCTDANQALERVRADPAAYALVITDQTMPGMSGVDLAQRLNVIRPELPIILTSGCTAGLRTDRLQGVRQLLAKPLTVRTLAAAVHQALSGTEASES